MAKGFCKVTLVGHLGADPDTRFSASGTAITTIRVATTESWKDKQTGEQQERTEWHRVKFFGKLGEIAGEYLKKGSLVLVEGKLRTEEYEKDGSKRYSTDIVADEMQMLGPKPNGERQQPAGGGASSGSNRPSPQRNTPAPSPAQRQPQPQQRRPEPEFVGGGDDFGGGLDDQHF